MSLANEIKSAKVSSPNMAALSSDIRNLALSTFASLIDKNRSLLLDANKIDLNEQKGKISNSLYARLELSNSKIDQIVQGVRDLSQLPCPLEGVISHLELDKGLTLKQVPVPIGLVCVIFESRPDVIPQVLSLMLKSGNCCILKGGSEAINTNQCFMNLVSQLNSQHTEIPKTWATLIESRQEVKELLQMNDYIDLIIPRGSNQLVQFIQDNTKIPVLGHADGVCHIFVDSEFDEKQALEIIIDSKTQYPSACNAVETILLHQDIAEDFFPKLLNALTESNVDVLVDKALQKDHPNLELCDDWHVEYSDLTVSIKIVSSTEEAIQHINQFGSHHTDVIVSQNKSHIEAFTRLVDSSSVMRNCSSRFADGFRYGMGAEVGISTNKTHARGPVGLEGLLIYKFILEGDGHIVATYSGPKARAFSHIDLLKN